MSINVVDLKFTYKSSLTQDNNVLNNINFQIEDSDFVAIIGKTGCGKSTLIQNINGLLLPTEGKIYVGDFVVENKKMKDIKDLRKRIGMAFQFPEHQLFEESIIKDVMFGPLNFGFSQDEAKESAIKALEKVGINEDLFERAPYQLSGGQMRRVALAGILAYNPDILILDEPTAGLDPKGQVDMLNLFKELNESGLTIVIISHDFNQVMEYTKKTLYLKNGDVEYYGSTQELFDNTKLVEEYGLVQPLVIEFKNKLNAKGFNIKSCKYDDLVKELTKDYE